QTLREGSALQDGWHAPEADGRWTSERASVQLRGEHLERVRVVLSTEPGRNVALACAGRRAEARASEKQREFELEIDLRGLREPWLEIFAAPVFVSAEQRRHGDTRRLGAFVRRIAVRSAHGELELDLRESTPSPARSFTLTRDRFRLPFNRGIVRGADAFIVHSAFVREKIRGARKTPASIAVVPHGAQARWSDEGRGVARARLGLPDDWCDGILVTSFGNVQAHKRIEPLLQAFAAARAVRPDLRLALIGTEDRESLDAPALVRRFGLESSVRLTGRVHETEAWPWIHAGDFAVQLRGPSSGGTSGGVFQSLGLGRAVIASDLDEQRELPASCVLRVAPGPDEAADLTRLILELAADPARRAELERGARAFVETECSWSRVARLYAENLEVFCRARGSKRSPRRQVGR
ncbi:MAG TPA: glycosyltransferase family 4 protein, partial [Planctomycetota bacterium]|nr:glycosyltransferase family 4 protein [Planctomycetota bacterium]